MIKFEHVTKIYPNSNHPAVDDLNLHIKEGEICVLVGPSGCGKTTSMKMINRLIEPTKGTIYIDGKDSKEVNPIQLRLNIGYVIQEIGLFPHMTIEQNIATVPLEKGWKKDKIKKKVDELLNLVALDPEIYKKRYPSDLSGGQRQRVGVARALAADPPVMLMDEPFGALDPITRSRLQDEFLRVQEKIKKTIVFVTHDIDEAIKMGDKIAVMQKGKLVQFASPAELLSSPANEFVENLVGGNRTLKRLNLIKCRESMHEPITVTSDTSLDKVRELITETKVKHVAVIEGDNKLIGYILSKNLKNKVGVAKDIAKPIEATVTAKTALNDALSEMFNIGQQFIHVVNEHDRLEGLITINDVLKAVSDND